MKKINILTASFFIAAMVFGGGLAAGSVTQAQGTPVTCSVGSTPGPLTASVSTAEVTLFASGGTGDYVWSSPNFMIADPTTSNSRFDLTFRVPGNYAFTVTSGGTSSTCQLSVTGIESPAPGGVEFPAPGLPNTGELPV